MFAAVLRSRRSRRPIVPALLLALSTTLSLGGCESVPLGGLPALEDDSPLSREVGEALRDDPVLMPFAIQVKSLDGGTVRLSGLVDTAAQRDTAERVAAAVPGVRSVVNTLYLRD